MQSLKRAASVAPKLSSLSTPVAVMGDFNLIHHPWGAPDFNYADVTFDDFNDGPLLFKSF
jgi:hypothetical protein